jgi:hypothetical protein
MGEIVADHDEQRPSHGTMIARAAPDPDGGAPRELAG